VVCERRPRWLLAACFCLLAWPAAAADLWDQLGPARIGAGRAEIAGEISVTCSAAGDGQVCTASTGTGLTFAGLPVRAMELRFAEERLVRVAVRFSEQHYRALLAFLGTQFGASDDRSFRARGGMAMAEFEAGVHVWEHDGVSLVLEQFAGKIDRSVLAYGSAAEMADLVRSKTSYPRGARRDL
jgi:hypothetical protein